MSLPGALLALMPKCPMCLAAYVAICTGFTMTYASAHVLTRSLIALCLGTLALMSAAQPLTPERKIVSGKKGVIISDGIAAESKEAIGGFFIITAASMDEAVNIARTCPMFKHGGQLEVRQMATLDCD